ncbi:MAG: S28 family serine protease [Myxococcota bacterium]
MPRIIWLAIAAALLSTAASCGHDLSSPSAENDILFGLEQSGDIAAQLAAVPGLDVVEVPDQAPAGYRFFLLSYSQPVDHDAPAGAHFVQQMALLHRDSDAPMVFEPLGYSLYAPHVAELTELLGANQLTVEHRYFGSSRPEPATWHHLTIDQAAADHHRVVQAIRPLYSGAWVSTGVSKGGMTAMYHRRFYPDDVDATVPYVAPLSFGPEDPRYQPFLDHLGDADCRQRIRDYQREALSRRDSLVPILEALAAQYGTGFNLIRGGADAALDVTVGEYQFTFWQYGPGSSACATIPGVDADDLAMLEPIMQNGFATTDLGVTEYRPYYYQAMTQLGYPRIDVSHLADLLTVDPNDPTLYTDGLPQPAFDWWAMFDNALWAFFEAESILYLYGDSDPWTAAAFPIHPLGKRDTHTFTVAQGNHQARILDLDPAERDQALTILESWTGVAIDTAAITQARRARPRAHALRDGWGQHRQPPRLSL